MDGRTLNEPKVRTKGRKQINCHSYLEDPAVVFGNPRKKLILISSSCLKSTNSRKVSFYRPLLIKCQYFRMYTGAHLHYYTLQPLYFSFSSMHLSSAFLLFFFASLAIISTARSAPTPEEEAAGMRSALEYLQRLDKYYSQAARPRYVS